MCFSANSAIADCPASGHLVRFVRMALTAELSGSMVVAHRTCDNVNVAAVAWFDEKVIARAKVHTDLSNS
jgi:hypothetical protein